MTDASFIAKTADLLHLLKYAQIQTASPSDAALAQQLIGELQSELRRGGKVELPWGMTPMDARRSSHA